MVELNLDIYKATNEVFKRLNNLRRWTSCVTEGKYNELAKQALNCAITYNLAAYAEENGHPIAWEKFPRIALFRAFQKVYVYFDTPEHIVDEVCKIGNIEKSVFLTATRELIAEYTNPEFSDFISQDLGSYEYQIYRAATKIATLVELMEIQSKTKHFEEYNKKLVEITKSLEDFSEFEGMEELADTNSELFRIFQKISKMRNQNRWAVYAYMMDCSVLGHLFDTGVFSYYMALEKQMDEAMAAKFFFMGIFHDVAEAWTTDIPSPIKNRIAGLREATEEFEARMLEKHLYSKVPPFLAQKLKEVMFEESSNLKFKKLMKGADYLSADSECWRQYIGGSREVYFLGAIQGFESDLTQGLKVELTPLAREFHGWFLKDAERLNG